MNSHRPARLPRQPRAVLTAALMVAVVPVLMVLLLGCSSDPTSNSSLPTVSAIVPASAKVGDTIAIQGSGFGTTQGEAGFQDPTTGNKIPSAVVAWSDTVILTKVPFVPGSQTGNVTTKIGFATSDGKSPASLPSFTITTSS